MKPALNWIQATPGLASLSMKPCITLLSFTLAVNMFAESFSDLSFETACEKAKQSGKIVFELSQQILKYDSSAATHRALAEAAIRAGNVQLARNLKQ